MTKVERCGLCANCQWVLRWEARYKDFLKNNPKEIKFINRQRAIDNKTLPCFDSFSELTHESAGPTFGVLDQLGDTVEDYLP